MRKIERNRSDNGVAIIIVLGLIAVLTLAAVAFSVSMRVERKGAATFRDAVQARHMLWAALAHAIEDINDSMNPTNGPMLLYPDWSVLSSSGADWGHTRAPALSPSSEVYIPDAFISGTYTRTSTWTRIDVNGLVRGRYAYVAINTSGLLDANRVASASAVRRRGASAAEIQIDKLPEFGTPGDVAAFLTDRTADERYETLAELTYLNDVGNSSLSSFDVYSLSFENKELMDNGKTVRRAYIGSNTTYWSFSDITNALALSGLDPLTEVPRAYTNLLDYIDADSVPQDNGDGAAVEAVPMINEFLVEELPAGYNHLTVDPSGSNYQWLLVLDIECIYPFLNSPAGTYWLDYRVDFVNNGGNASILPAVTLSNRVDITAAGIGPAVPFVSVQMIVNKSGTITGPNPNSLNFNMIFSGSIKDQDDQVVDLVLSPAEGGAITVNLVTNLVPNLQASFTAFSECIDPRFNYRSVEWKLGTSPEMQVAAPGGAKATKNAPNNFTKFMMNAPAPYNTMLVDKDKDLVSYVKNAPVESIGELGYLAYDQFETIRLTDHVVGGATATCHKAFDYFTVVPPGAFTHGRINASTENEDVMASVFFEVPIDDYRAAPAVIGNSVFANNVAQDIVDGGPYRHLSELGRRQVVNWAARVNSITNNPSEIAIEAPLRNSVGLLTTRHNLFTFLLVADSYSTGIGGDLATGSTLASSRAVAQVWRDPFPVQDENGNTSRDSTGRPVYRTFIRFFKMLDD